MLARDILQDDNIFDEEYISNNRYIQKDIYNAVKEIDRVIELLEMLPYDDFEFIEAFRILKGKNE